ncbi:Glucosamine-6-phosphate deaminase 1 [Rubripirellula lacrimiformis]|uniref:Glucosamine-6-phosphate deaminase 1 n=1 Tax=Rubripirellula lacrimiformis TaxID=1930273 RepID=A0A517NFW3_9BACT|nr:glucosamine-6-phosphate deaminase [Rubripirellula lacrimiformis]QDT05991.1 Glucosamine-6-phosphate deaminase 1 [Rubripirellula lacrimiformis]
MTTNPNERIACRIFSRASDASVAVAAEIADLIRSQAASGKNAVLGLVAGSSPVNVYTELVRLHQNGELSFANVVTFNSDEYHPMQPTELQSISRFMHEHLFDHVDIDPANVHIPDGTVAKEHSPTYCAHYEQLIRDAGGIDLQLLGINRAGHIGLNEPGSDRGSRTRLITLDQPTRTDAASDFFGAENVPRHAITMGVGTLLDARRVLLLAFGEGKADIVARTVEGYAGANVPSTFLQDHPSVEALLDDAAASRLTRVQSPWLLGEVAWDDITTRRAVIDLAEGVGKAILKLTDADYNEHGLQDLLAAHGSSYDINLRVFRNLQSTIIGWPGGKPEHRKRPGDRPGHRDDIFPKRVIVFSPHPDDDVISMGGTLIRLVDQGHDVHIAYQTSGNIAVFDEDALRFAEFVEDFCTEFGIQAGGLEAIAHHVDEFLRNKKSGQLDSEEVLRIKGLIRRGEARQGARCCGVPDANLHYLDLPFYQTGRITKRPLSDEDVGITVDLLRQIEPHQIYAAGDLSDPHGTHRTCLSAILQACVICQNDPWYEACAVWMYRGAWQEWAPHQIEMAVPLSPQEVARKRVAIFKHESQKDRALFPGSDLREFWQRAEARNADTARRYDELGLAEYAAIEGFVRWDGSTGIEL